jgi:hypothetical protein
MRFSCFHKSRLSTGFHINNAMYPPPLRYSRSIVALVTRNLGDALESQITLWAGVQGRVAGAVVKQVTG